MIPIVPVVCCLVGVVVGVGLTLFAGFLVMLCGGGLRRDQDVEDDDDELEQAPEEMRKAFDEAVEDLLHKAAREAIERIKTKRLQ